MLEDGGGRRTSRHPEEINPEAEELGKGTRLETLEDYMAGMKDEMRS